MNEMKRMILVFMVFYTSLLAAQNASFKQQMRFSKYLFENNFWEDCKTFVKHNASDPTFSPEQRDSLYHFAGQVYFKTADFDTASLFFSKISSQSSFHKEAALFSTISLAEVSRYDESKHILEGITPSEIISQEFLNFEIFGAKLLSRDTAGCNQLAKTFTFSDKTYSLEETKLIQLQGRIENIRHKSGFLAGFISAVVPGLGKIYAGKPRQGLTSFVPVAGLGIQAYEAYRKSGIKSVRFILSAGLFSIFYIGNIWGSVLSVTVSRTELNNEINDQILFNMRIPLHRLFREN